MSGILPAEAVPYISVEAIDRVLVMDRLIDAMADAYAAFSTGKVVQPVRSAVPLKSRYGTLLLMPAVAGMATVKLVSVCPANEALGIATHQALIVALDAETGVPIAMLDGNLITERRTAAASVAALRALTDAPPEKVAIIGAGVQARSHIAALRTLYGDLDIAVASRRRANADALAAEAGARSGETEAIVKDADVVICATTSREPVIFDRWLKDGAVVISVGAPLPQWRELGDCVMRNPLVVDSRDAALAESGDIVATGAEIAAEIGEILAGTVPRPAGRVTVFKSGGLAVQDCEAARLVLDSLGRS